MSCSIFAVIKAGLACRKDCFMDFLSKLCDLAHFVNPDFYYITPERKSLIYRSA